MSDQNARIAQITLWINAILVLCTVLLFWRLCSQGEVLPRLFPEWGPPDRWLLALFAVHVATAWLMAFNLVVYLKLRPDEGSVPADPADEAPAQNWQKVSKFPIELLSARAGL